MPTWYLIVAGVLFVIGMGYAIGSDDPVFPVDNFLQTLGLLCACLAWIILLPILAVAAVVARWEDR